MSKPKLFRTPDTFPIAAEAVGFFNENRSDGVDEIPKEVLDFLEFVEAYDPDAVFNVQPSFATHYIACARPGVDHHSWFYAKPSGVTFLVGDERNVEAVFDMYGPSETEPPPKLLSTDIWLEAKELTEPIADMCLRLAAAWAVDHVGSRA